MPFRHVRTRAHTQPGKRAAPPPPARFNATCPLLVPASDNWHGYAHLVELLGGFFAKSLNSQQSPWAVFRHTERGVTQLGGGGGKEEKEFQFELACLPTSPEHMASFDHS